MILRWRGRVLLMHDHDPGVAPGLEWWAVPGGGLDAGEDWHTGAAREVFEETGIRLHAASLLGPIAHRSVVHGYSDRVLTQEEMFLAADLTDSQAAQAGGTAGFTDRERIMLLGWGWFSLPELTSMRVWPAVLPQLIGLDGSACVELGSVEESTVLAD